MSITAAPLTELEAVNEMLGVGSESPISTLNESQVIEAGLAKKLLRTTSIEVQTAGWFFNQEQGVPVSPNQENEIILPQNVLRIDTSGDSASIQGVQRGERLWNKTDRTFKFDGEVTVDWVLGLSFEELPSSARNYITIKAARKFQDRYVDDESLHQYTKQDEIDALTWLKEEQIDSDDPNMLNDSQFAIQLGDRS